MKYIIFIKSNIFSIFLIILRTLYFLSGTAYVIKTKTMENGMCSESIDNSLSLVFLLCLIFNTKIVLPSTKQNKVYLCYGKSIISIICPVFAYKSPYWYITIEMIQMLDIIMYSMVDKSEEKYGPNIKKLHRK